MNKRNAQGPTRPRGNKDRKGPAGRAADKGTARSGGGGGARKRSARPTDDAPPHRPKASRPGARPGPGKDPRPDRGEGGTKGPRRAGPARGAKPHAPDWKQRGTARPKPFRREGKRGPARPTDSPVPDSNGPVRLNKYLAQAGVGSRREADELIASGTVTVNGQVVTELGTKVSPGDAVHFGGQKLRMEQKRYVLLNKPKDTITTTDDPQERHTVMSLIAKACSERLYPVGRLDRNTTGVLLLTNDGDLAKKLTHPSHGAPKIYHATLDRTLTVEELHKLVEGVMLEDGPAKADEASFVGGQRNEVGLRLHIGRNRVVRRMFTALGAEVVKLDRVLFAGLSKKDLPRGHWRHLSEKEVVWLKQMQVAAPGAKPARAGRRTRLSQGSE